MEYICKSQVAAIENKLLLGNDVLNSGENIIMDIFSFESSVIILKDDWFDLCLLEAENIIYRFDGLKGKSYHYKVRAREITRKETTLYLEVYETHSFQPKIYDRDII